MNLEKDALKNGSRFLKVHNVCGLSTKDHKTQKYSFALTNITADIIGGVEVVSLSSSVSSF